MAQYLCVPCVGVEGSYGAYDPYQVVVSLFMSGGMRIIMCRKASTAGRACIGKSAYCFPTFSRNVPPPSTTLLKQQVLPMIGSHTKRVEIPQGCSKAYFPSLAPIIETRYKRLLFSCLDDAFWTLWRYPVGNLRRRPRRCCRRRPGRPGRRRTTMQADPVRSFDPDHARVLVVGPMASGKTTLVRSLCHGDGAGGGARLRPPPTVGCNVDVKVMRTRKARVVDAFSRGLVRCCLRAIVRSRG